ncbi:MAG: hypothetical protein M3417_03835 [Actinomycetota bacterium]|nr:hypothetical protein [Actinomycetota bacterium]
MGATSLLSPAPRPVELRGTVALAALGAWTIVVPYLATLLGLEVKVPSLVEVVDHVIPGALVAGAGLYLASLARRRALAGASSALLAGGACFLAGFWVLATHAPLLAEAARANLSWSAALWHSATALPIVALSLWCVLRSTPADPGR